MGFILLIQIITLEHSNKTSAPAISFDLNIDGLNSRPVVPNHCSGDHKCSANNLEVLPEKFEIHNTLS